VSLSQGVQKGSTGAKIEKFLMSPRQESRPWPHYLQQHWPWPRPRRRLVVGEAPLIALPTSHGWGLRLCALGRHSWLLAAACCPGARC
jgi:hypothetical protein